MDKKVIEIRGEMELTYDPNSIEVKEALASYQDIIEVEGTLDDMLRHVAFHVTRFGDHTMVEGVGYVGYNGRKPKENYCGIMIGEDYDEMDFTIQ